MQFKNVFGQISAVALALVAVSITPMSASATVDPGCVTTITRAGSAASESDVPVTTSGIYCVASFNTVASNYAFTVPADITRVDYLVVGGGGGGASGGGGAGGFLTGSNYAVTPGASISIAVGAGGNAGAGSNTASTNGANSSFGSSIVAIGGGGGGANYISNTPNGGSGGGSRWDCTSALCGGGLAGTGTTGQGNNGGYSTYNSYGAGGGGGGAGGAGFNTTRLYVGGNGGAGLSSDITGSTVWYAGGGGGGVNNNDNRYVDVTNGVQTLSVTAVTTGGGQGGIGGGGRGTSYGYTSATTLGANANATSGAANTGGGGGGTDPEDIGAGNGGSGVVIVRWISSSHLKTVTFNSNLSSATTTTQKVGSGLATALNNNTFSKTGWVFSGWTTNADGTGTLYADGDSITTSNDITLYAKWLPGVTHTVTFDANQGSGTMANQVSGSTTNLIANTFTRSNYTFAGWNTAANGSGFAYSNGASYSFSEDTTLYAQWQQIVASYKVTFYGNGAESGATASQVASTTTALNLNGFTKAGYNFLGWNATYNAGTATYLDGQNYAFSTDIELYAQWVAQTNNTIVYDSNGSLGAPTTGTMADQIASSRTLITPNAYSRAGFTFKNWNTAANGSGVTYQSNYSYNFATSRTLYAQWGANIEVSYDANTADSGTAPGAQATYNGSPGVNLALNSGRLVKAGYRLAGWNTLANGNGTPYALGASSIRFTANQVLYAHWTPATYSVIYSGNGSTAGSEPTAQTFQYGSALNVSDNTGSLARSGYTFEGWNTAADGTGTTIAAAATNVSLTTDTVLYAKWAQVPVQNNNSGAQNPVQAPIETTPVTPPVTSTVKPPVTLIVSGFDAGSAKLSSNMQAKIKAFVKKNASYAKLSVTGYTEGPTVLKSDLALSKARAKAVSKYINAVLGVKAPATTWFAKQETRKAAVLRKVKITLSN